MQITINQKGITIDALCHQVFGDTQSTEAVLHKNKGLAATLLPSGFFPLGSIIHIDQRQTKKPSQLVQLWD